MSTASFLWQRDCAHLQILLHREVGENESRNLACGEAEAPDVALIIVSNFLSNPAKDYLDDYRRNRKPFFKIKVWEKPTLEKLASRKISLLRKYDLTHIPIRSTQNILKAEQEF